VDFTSKDAVVNTIMKAQIVQDDKTVDVATTPVKDGWSSVSVKVPTAKGLVSGEATTVFTFPDSGTTVRFAAKLSVPSGDHPGGAVIPAPKPGQSGTPGHDVNLEPPDLTKAPATANPACRKLVSDPRIDTTSY